MKRLLVFPSLLLLCSVNYGIEPKKSTTKLAEPDQAIARVTGNVICAHCDLGVGEECCSAFQIGDSVIVLAGQANKELFDARLSGPSARVLGTLSVKDGMLHLHGVRDKQLPKDAKSEMLVTGKIIQDDKTLSLKNAKFPVWLRGDTADKLQKNANQWLEIAGQLDVDRKGKITLKVATTKETKGPPRVAGVNIPGERQTP